MRTTNLTSEMENRSELESIQNFYDSIYYKDATFSTSATPHYRRLADRLGISANDRILDVACGLGLWLSVCKQRGAIPSGVDLSERAISVCKQVMPDGAFFAQPAESLPFEDRSFDVVTCLGSLEHFVEQEAAVREMVRVAKSDARFLILVPNDGFLTRRLGLYRGTNQVVAKEVMHSLDGWARIFERCGLQVDKRWRDLHVLSRSWIFSRGLASAPLRASQAIALTVWPLSWQYQVYHLCQRKK